MDKYRLEGPITLASLSTFLQSFEEKKLVKYTRHQDPLEAPEESGDIVKTLVSSTFDVAVEDHGSNTIVFFIVPANLANERFYACFRSLAEQFADSSELTFA